MFWFQNDLIDSSVTISGTFAVADEFTKVITLLLLGSGQGIEPLMMYISGTLYQ